VKTPVFSLALSHAGLGAVYALEFNQLRLGDKKGRDCNFKMGVLTVVKLRWDCDI
jgi:hypothetical protein